MAAFLPPARASAVGSRGIALGGFMGAGKSTVGRGLARRVGLPFVDVDEILEARWGPIAEQLAGVGEAAFRARERAVIRELCDGVPRIVATGGGAWVDPANRARLEAAYHTVVLVAPLEVLRARVGEGAGRPLWSQAADRLRARQPAYADAALHVDVSRRTVAEVVDAVLAGLADPAAERVELGPTVVCRGAFRGLGALLSERGARRVALTTDERVAALWRDALREELGRAGLDAIDAPVGPDLARGAGVGGPVVALGGRAVLDAARRIAGEGIVVVPTTARAMLAPPIGAALRWIGVATASTLPDGALRAQLAAAAARGYLDTAARAGVADRRAALERGELDPWFTLLAAGHAGPSDG